MVAGSCKNSNELFGFIRSGVFLELSELISHDGLCCVQLVLLCLTSEAGLFKYNFIF
jgi:hypothetical protein